MSTATPRRVYLDSNVWDLLFTRKIDLAQALPEPEFRILITREAEFEIPPIPEEKAELKAFIASTIDWCGIETDRLFGFADPTWPTNKQRVGGFDEGRWAQPEELAFIERWRARMTGKFRKTGLYKHEADVSLAARSFTGVVLTLDMKTGPLKQAFNEGGNVVFLADLERSGLSFSDFVRAGI